MNNYFDKIFIINLNERQDRWKKLKETLDNLGISNYQRFPAIKLTQEQAKTLYPKHYAMIEKIQKKKGFAYNPAYATGQIGCKLSHYKVIKLAKQKNYKRILVLEDDTAFYPHFLEHFNKFAPPKSLKWSFLYLTVNAIKPSLPISGYPNLKKITRAYAASAYGIDSSIYDHILGEMMTYPTEGDVYYADRIHPRFECLCFSPHLCYQEAGFSNILGRKVNYEQLFKRNI